jgi:hypothetical protein
LLMTSPQFNNLPGPSLHGRSFLTSTSPTLAAIVNTSLFLSIFILTAFCTTTVPAPGTPATRLSQLFLTFPVHLSTL